MTTRRGKPCSSIPLKGTHDTLLWKEKSSFPSQLPRLSNLVFSRKMRWCGWKGGFKRKGWNIFQCPIPFFAPKCAHTLIFLIEETPYFRRVCSLSICTSTDSSQNPFISRVRGIISRGIFQLQHTRLWRLMVYSRDTTSEIAERVFLPVFAEDISGRCQ